MNRELQLDFSNNNNKNNLSKFVFDYEKTQTYAIFYCVFVKSWDGKDFPGLS